MPAGLTHDLLWRDIMATYLDAASSKSALPVAVEAFTQLALLAPLAPQLTHQQAVQKAGVQLLTRLASDDKSQGVRAVWRALTVLGAPTPSTTAPIVRRLVLRNRLSDALYVLRWQIQEYWLVGAPVPSRAVMHTVMIQMRVVEEVLRTRAAPSPGRFGASDPLYDEYAAALSMLGVLLRENFFPLLPHAKEDVTWLLKLLARFPQLRFRTPLAALRRRQVRQSLRVFLERLPCGRPPATAAFFTAVPQISRRIDREKYFVPVLSERSYNVLIHYTLQHADRLPQCRHLLEHMTRERCPPLSPSDVTVNILVRQATRLKMPALAEFALELGTNVQPALSPPPPDSVWESPALDTPRLLAMLDEALRDADTHRVAALVHHIGRFHLRSATNPHGVRATSVLLRMYPELRRKRPRENLPVVYDAGVGTAALRLAARSQHVTLALHVWRLLKQSCIAQSQPMPPAAAAVMMQLLARIAGRPRWVYTRRGRERDTSSQQIVLIALREYAWLLHHGGATQSAPRIDVYIPLLRLLRRTRSHRDIVARVVGDMHALGLADHPRLQQALRVTPPFSDTPR